MSKWKCGICNNEFDNFQAQGFGGTIYCPLCYFKELYRRTELERERLNNIINELEKWLNEKTELMKSYSIERMVAYNASLDKLDELKGDNK